MSSSPRPDSTPNASSSHTVSAQMLITSAAFLDLDTQVAVHALTAADVAPLRVAYADAAMLCAALEAAGRSAQAQLVLVDEQVQGERDAVVTSTARKAELVAAAALAESERADAAVALAALDTRETAINADLQEMRARELQATSDLEDARSRNKATVEPVLTGLSDALAELARETSLCESATTQANSNSKALTARTQHIIRSTTAHRAALEASRLELNRLRSEPSKLAQQNASIGRVLSALQEQIATSRASIAAREADLRAQADALTQVGIVRGPLGAALSQHRSEIEAREKEVAGLERILRKERGEGKDLAERRVGALADKEVMDAGAAAARMKLEGTQRAFERAKHAYKRAMDVADEAKANLIPLTAEVSHKETELATKLRVTASKEAAAGVVRSEMDLLVAQFVKEEAIEKRHRDAVAVVAARCSALNDEKMQWHEEEALALKQLAALKAQRDLKEREAIKMEAAHKEAVESSELKELLLNDLNAQLTAAAVRTRKHSDLYEVAQAERNALTKALNACLQSGGEMRDRMRLIASELESLKNETHTKDCAGDVERHALEAATARYDKLRLDANRQMALARERGQALEDATVSVDSLSNTIAALQRDLAALRREHAGAVESRNATGIRLIDANEEFVLLCEKAAVHERTLERGELALREVGEESRSLRVAVADLERAGALARRTMTDAPALIARVVALRDDVAATRARADKLGDALVDPANESRITRLPGEDPDAHELSAIEALFVQRVSAARESLLQGQVALDQMRSARDASLKEAEGGGAGGASSAVGAAKAVNDLGARIREVSKRLMAAVAELSLHQAQEMRLAGEVEAAHAAQAAAEEEASGGGPPTAAAELKWASTQRASSLLHSRSSAGGSQEAPELQRPNVYVPEGVITNGLGHVGLPPLGLPKPYAGFAPPMAPSKR